MLAAKWAGWLSRKDKLEAGRLSSVLRWSCAMIHSSPNLPSSSPILTFILIVVMGLVMITMGKWFVGVEAPAEEKRPLDALSQKMVGRWENTKADNVLELDLDEEGNFRYALRDSDRLSLRGKWKMEEGRLVLHIEQVNGGSTYREGENVTLGEVLQAEGRTLTLGTEENKTIFRKRRST